MEEQQPTTRSVKIGEDERTGWSSERPRREGGPARPPDVSVRCRTLSPASEVRYSPGSLVVVVSPSAAERDRLADRLDKRAPMLSLDKVRSLLAGQVGEDEIDDRARQVLEAAVRKRLEDNESVVVAMDTLEPEERERYVRMAHAVRRPRHLILIDASKEGVDEEDRAALNEVRRRLDAGELGTEGFQTAMRLGGGSVSDLKRIIFRPPPRDDD
jgi:predicted kinase